MDQKIEPWGAKGRNKVPGPSQGGAFWARRVRGAASRARTSEEKNDREADEQLVRDLTRHGPKIPPRVIARWCIFGQEGPGGRLARAD